MTTSIERGKAFVDSRRVVSHHGILGMHWGIRKARVSASAKLRQELTRQEKVDRRNKIIKYAYEGGVAIGGLAYAGMYVKGMSPEIMYLANSAGGKVAAARGKKATESIVKSLAAKGTTRLIKGADGVFRLAA